MAMTEKEVFFALLKNLPTPTTLASVCRLCGVSYNQIYKRAQSNTLHKMPMTDLMKICKVIGVSDDDLLKLLTKATNGEFPDDYPLDEIKLKVFDASLINDRVVPMMLTVEEVEAIAAMRAGSEKKINQFLKQLEDK